jgi:hypothetical protein
VSLYDLPRMPAAIGQYVEATAGAITLAECRALGIADETVFWLDESGRWQSPFPRTYVVFSGPIPRETLEEAALAYAGEDVALCLISSDALGLVRRPERRAHRRAVRPPGQTTAVARTASVSRSSTRTHPPCEAAEASAH